MKVGDYVRTKSNHILRITDIKDNLFKDDSSKTPDVYYPISIIEKSSSNIIDLIEVGDYVNGSKVKDKWYNYATKHWRLEDNGGYIVTGEEDIKSIVTKEQFKKMKYRIEREVN